MLALLLYSTDICCDFPEFYRYTDYRDRVYLTF